MASLGVPRHLGAMSKAAHPVIGVVADVRRSRLPTYAVMEKYVAAARDGAGGLPLLIPPAADAEGTDAPDAEVAAILDRVDALLLPGSPSNVDPARYGAAARPDLQGDLDRDRLALPLIRAAVARGTPLLAICRGFQEMNVALGGTLHPALHERPGVADHREDLSQPEAVRYGPAHEVRFAPGGVLVGLAGPSARVNSLHGQGIDRLAPSLAVEAEASDGVIEAARVAHATRFALGVQWHPEWRFAEDALSRALFTAFGAAARERP